MTIRERIISVYRGQIPDKPPLGIYSRYLRSGDIERRTRTRGLGILDFFPPVSLLAPPWHIQPGYVSEVRNAILDVKISWKDGQMVETRTLETSKGNISQITAKDPSSGSDWILKPYLERPEDLRVMSHLAEETIFRDQTPAFRQRTTDLGEDGVVLARLDRSPYQKLLIELVDPQRFLIDFSLDPDPYEELMEVMGRRLDEQFELALASDAEILWQPDNITSDMTPPRFFEKYCLPFYAKRGAACREAGKIYAVHMDGRTRALKDLIAACPIDVIESFSLPDIGGDLPIPEAIRAWPDKVVCPNVPSTLCLKADEEIERYLSGVAADFGRDRPFMLQISEDIPPETYSRILPILARFMNDRANL